MDNKKPEIYFFTLTGIVTAIFVMASLTHPCVNNYTRIVNKDYVNCKLLQIVVTLLQIF